MSGIAPVSLPCAFSHSTYLALMPLLCCFLSPKMGLYPSALANSFSLVKIQCRFSPPGSFL